MAMESHLERAIEAFFFDLGYEKHIEWGAAKHQPA
jgi:hypothetical protein